MIVLPQPQPSSAGVVASEWWAACESPLSYTEERFYRRYQAHGGRRDWRGSVRLLKGRLDAEALRRAHEHVVGLHAVLRSRFVARGTEVHRTILPAGRFELPVVDLSATPEPERSQRLVEALAGDLSYDCDLARDAPLLRSRLYRLEALVHALVIAAPHIVFDATSAGCFAEQCAAAYGVLLHGGEPSPGVLGPQYPDYAAWQRDHYVGEHLARSRAAYERRVEGGAALARALPPDHPFDAVDAARKSDPLALSPSASAIEHLAAPLVAVIRQLAGSRHMSEAAWYLGAMTAVSGRLARTQRPALSVVSDARLKIVGMLERIGNFITSTPVSVDLAGAHTVEAVAGRANAALLQVLGADDLPVVPLVHPTLHDIQRAQFNFIRHGDPPKLDGLAIELLPEAQRRQLAPSTSGTLLDVYLEVRTTNEGHAIAMLTMNCAVWERATVQRLLKAMVKWLELAVREPSAQADAVVDQALEGPAQ